MRRRGVRLIVAVAAALLLASGVAIAATLTCQTGSISTNPCKGTNSDDTLIGTLGDDYIIGGPTTHGYGDDIINGREGNDKLYGGYNDDTITGNGGDDTVDGGYNRDTLDGGNGNDKIYGYYNRDKIIGGFGEDTISGGNDDDNVDAADGEIDYINCGTGTDTLKADAYADGTPLDKNADNTPLTNADNTPLNRSSSSCENITWVKPSSPSP